MTNLTQSVINYYDGTPHMGVLTMYPWPHDPTKVYLQLVNTDDLVNINMHTEELIAAVNKIPGVTATFEKPQPPKPKLRELPAGTAFRFGNGTNGQLYIKLTDGRHYSPDRSRIVETWVSDLDREVTVITEGENL